MFFFEKMWMRGSACSLFENHFSREPKRMLAFFGNDGSSFVTGPNLEVCLKNKLFTGMNMLGGGVGSAIFTPKFFTPHPGRTTIPWSRGQDSVSGPDLGRFERKPPLSALRKSALLLRPGEGPCLVVFREIYLSGAFSRG